MSIPSESKDRMIESVAPAVSGGLGFLELLDPGESCDEPFVPVSSPAGSSSRFRLMCSFGGRIVPRAADKSLCYAGGDNRMVVVDRRDSLADLTARISAVYSGRPFILKYQLPNEDLDSLISVTTDEDLENMIEEYDRILDSSTGRLSTTATIGGGGGGGEGYNRPGRLRLFLFPAKSESAPASTIGSLLDNSQSESWLDDAFDNAMSDLGIDGIARGQSADAASVATLLDLADDSSVLSLGRAASGGGGDSKHDQVVLPRPDSYGKLTQQGQEVHSVPDSPMLDHSSSFDSNSSAPPLSNLPPIRPDELSLSHQLSGLDDQFSHLNLPSHAPSTTSPAIGSVEELEQSYKQSINSAQHHPPRSILLSNSPTSQATSISPTENTTRALFSDNNQSDHGGNRKLQPAKQTQIDVLMPESVSRPAFSNTNTDLWKAHPVSSDSDLQIQVPVSDSSAGYQLPQEQLLLEHQQREQLQQEQEQKHQAFQRILNQQQHFIPAATHYIHHPATGAVVPVPSYYHPYAAHPIQQTQQTHPYNQQVPIYYFQVPQAPYNLSTMQPKVGNPNSITSAGTTALPVSQANHNPELPKSLYGNVAAPSPVALQPQLIPVSAEQAHSYAGMGYPVVPQHHLPQSPASMPGYCYEYAADPARAQMYYSQASFPLVSGPQYQTVRSPAVNVNAVPPRDMRPTGAP